MKLLLVLSVGVSLASCNTSIGVWRDTKAAVKWTAGKIAGADNDKYDTEYGAPVY